MNNYEYSVQSALAQQGARADRANVQHVADINELESLLNDSIAKQKVRWPDGVHAYPSLILPSTNSG